MSGNANGVSTRSTGESLRQRAFASLASRLRSETVAREHAAGEERERTLARLRRLLSVTFLLRPVEIENAPVHWSHDWPIVELDGLPFRLDPDPVTRTAIQVSLSGCCSPDVPRWRSVYSLSGLAELLEEHGAFAEAHS